MIKISREFAKKNEGKLTFYMYKSIEPLGIDRKYNLMLNEATEYFGIVINPLRELTNREGKNCDTRRG